MNRLFISNSKLMTRFIVNFVLFISALAGSICFIMYQADGYSDPYYLKFTTPKQGSLIIGTSKALQGLNPDPMKEILDKGIYNYAFDISKSPFGPKYLESIKRKLSSKSRHGIFIITVDCWSIYSKRDDPNDIQNFSENNTCVGEMTVVDQFPNFYYLSNYMSGKYHKILSRPAVTFLHDNGWLEVSLDLDSISVARRTKTTLLEYEKYAEEYRFSKVRLDYLVQTINYLDDFGDVYLVRLPISPQLMQIENRLAPNFSNLMQLPAKRSCGFLDLTDKNSLFSYTDGVHLSKESGQIVSIEIAKWIQKNSDMRNLKTPLNP